MINTEEQPALHKTGAAAHRTGARKSIEEELRELSDGKLLLGIDLAVQGERRMTIRILHRLNEVERRRLYLDRGFSSLFDYCTRRLKYSSSAAARRISVARCIKRHPDVLEMLRVRELSLSTISLVASILNDDNNATILARVRGKSYREVERVASEYRPPVALRDRVRPVRVALPQPVDVDAALVDRELRHHSPWGQDDSAPCRSPATGAAGTVQKLLVQFLASEELMQKFGEAQALLSHRCANGSFAEVLDVIVNEFVDRHSPEARQKRRERRKQLKAKAAETNRSRRRECRNNNLAGRDTRQGQPRADRLRVDRPRLDPRRVDRPRLDPRRVDRPRLDPPQALRHIPNRVRDEVFIRDGGACTFVTRDGRRCGSKTRLQIDHVRPFVAGGAHGPTNLRLLCAAHNRRAAEQTLGKHIMKPFWPRE